MHILNSNSEFSINIHAENVLIKILDIIYECEFNNLNYEEGKNYNSIDLGDKDFKMSIQVTATKDIEKIKETISKYISKKHYQKYAELKVLTLTTRQKSYSSIVINRIINGRFLFNQSTDIIDFATLYVKLNKINDLSKCLAVLEILRSQFTDLAIRNEPIYSINNYSELKSLISQNLQITNELFKDFGPNSSAESKGLVRWDLTLWYSIRREKILPINNLVVKIIEDNISFIPEDKSKIYQKYLNHVFAFNKHCEDSDFDYSEHQFPKEIYAEVC